VTAIPQKMTASVAADLNRDDSRWAQIYQRVSLSQIPAHFQTFTNMPFLARYLETVQACCSPGSRALETGVGFGYGAIWLSLRGALATGIDYSQEIVDRANRINQCLNGSAYFYYGDMFRLKEYAHGTYDVIFHQGVLEHFSDEEIRAILAQQLEIGRQVVFSVPSVYYPYEKEFGNERNLSLEAWEKILTDYPVERLTYYGDPKLGGKEHIMGVLRGHPDAPPDSRRFHFIWNSPLLDPSGYADEARHFVLALEDTGHYITSQPIYWSHRPLILPYKEEMRFQNMIRRRPLAGSVFVSHIFAPQFTRREDACVNIGRTMFETDRLPEGWAEACNRMDMVWVPDAFNRQTFLRSGVREEKVRIVPGAIDLAPFDPQGTSLHIEGARGFRFLSVFDWSLRKGWDILLKSYIEEFSPEEDVSLIIKTHSSLGYSTQQIMQLASDFITHVLKRDPEQIPDIVFHDANIPGHQMPDLYRSAHCFVLPTRGEGWGRPYMEAMAAGLPTIGTNWSGNTAFMKPDNSYLIDCEEVPVPEAGWKEIPIYRGHRWAEPSCDHLRYLMRKVFSQREQAVQTGLRARSYLAKEFSYERVSQTIQSEVEYLLDNR
jgi:glycosyltransferase involved in cell wall biosynthesis/2-polyprenyl-3-methyl-5-hydroxy-6-metoxy-1,4-benzoquinol methylase